MCHFTTSKIIGKKPRGRWKTPPPVFIGSSRATLVIFYSHRAAQHPHACSVTKVKDSCTYSQLPPMSAEHRKVKFDEYSATASQRFCCRPCAWLYVQPWFHRHRYIKKKRCVACASKNDKHVAAALGSNNQRIRNSLQIATRVCQLANI